MDLKYSFSFSSIFKVVNLVDIDTTYASIYYLFVVAQMCLFSYSDKTTYYM